MPADPVLSRLVAEAERATAALRAYLDGAPIEAEPGLIGPREAEARYRISSDTRVRWAKDEGLGAKTEDGWCLSPSLVSKHKGR